MSLQCPLTYVNQQLLTCTLTLVVQVIVEAVEMVQAMHPSLKNLAAFTNTDKIKYK